MDHLKMYNICGLDVLAEFRYPRMKRLAEKYRCDFSAEPRLVLPFNEEKFEYYHGRYPRMSEENCEVMSSAFSFYRALLGFGGFFLHSSAVVVDGRAYLFSADSGTGKSTHTQLWLRRFGDRAYILNDDKPAVMLADGQLFAWGTPWSGKSDLNENRCVPLQGVCFIERSEKNSIRRIDASEALPEIIRQTLRVLETEDMERLLALLDKALPLCRCWRMGCNISPEAAELSYSAMTGE